MTILLEENTRHESPLSPELALFRLEQVIKDCDFKGRELSIKIDATNMKNSSFQSWEAPVRLSKELLQMLSNLEEVNSFVISKDALKPKQKLVKEALKLSLRSFSDLYEACRCTEDISRDTFDSSTTALRMVGNSLSLLLHEFSSKLSVNKGNTD